jgi:hypothetical protein
VYLFLKTPALLVSSKVSIERYVRDIYFVRQCILMSDLPMSLIVELIDDSKNCDEIHQLVRWGLSARAGVKAVPMSLLVGDARFG